MFHHHVQARASFENHGRILRKSLTPTCTHIDKVRTPIWSLQLSLQKESVKGNVRRAFYELADILLTVRPTFAKE
jgi:hypothetical protein